MKITLDKDCHVKAADLETGEIHTYSCFPCPGCGKWLHDNPAYHYCPYCAVRLER